MSHILKNMNPEQKEAVLHTSGPLLVLAGAGSGKTRVLTGRVAHLISEGVDPWRILAITFTNKAASEMKERINRLVGESCAQNIWVSTFHSFCARFLRYEIDSLGIYNKNFVIYDSDDSKTLIKNCLKELNLDDKQFPPNVIQGTISNAKNSLIDSDQFAYNADSFHSEKVAEVYNLYQTRLKINNALDFDDLLMLTIKVLENLEILEKYQNKFEHILIDEYQDTNLAQYELAKILSQKKKNIFVVGDADQSIYAWRGADIRNIMEFESDFPSARVIKLEQNYRSTQTILDAANAVIKNNYNRKDKKLWTENGEGDLISCYQAFSEQDEAKYIVENILKLNTIYNIPYNDTAVLYRTNAQSRIIEEWFLKYGISYTMVGGVRFYERKEIKDILAYLRVIFNPNDTLSLLRIINIPKRGIGGVTLKKLVDKANENNVPLFDIISNPDSVTGISDRVKKQLESFSTFIFEMISLIGQIPITDFINKVMNDSGYISYLESEDTIESQTRIENLRELLSVAKGFIEENIIPADASIETELEQFLTRVALIADVDDLDMDQNNRVTLMTLHAAKGLEFKAVFLSGLEEGLFPHIRTLMNETELEEERRLCYVGITRARQILYLTYASTRTIFGNTVSYRPSRFLKEIPSELLDVKMNYTIKAAKQRRNSLLEENNEQGFRKYNIGNTVPDKNSLDSLKRAAADSDRVKPDSWKLGDKLYHSKWGNGTVIEIAGSGDFIKLKIAFHNEEVKSLLANIAPIKKVQG